VIAEVATNLLGEIVEVYRWEQDCSRDDCHYHYSLRGRGHVRAVYVADKELMVLVEHDLGIQSVAYTDQAKDGGFEAYALHSRSGDFSIRMRVVQRCVRCYSWDPKALMFHQAGAPPNDTWEHKDRESCKKVGHDG